MRDYVIAAFVLAALGDQAVAQTTPAPRDATPPIAKPAPTPTPAAAVPQAPRPRRQAPAQLPESDISDEPEIIVSGQRNLPGSVVGDIPPEEQLSPADIRSYGVSSVAELLSEIAPQTYSGRGSGGQPVVLLNGKRISGFQEIRDLPTEAIARVDILPEEVALKYGYGADQRVVNFVLRRRFRAETAELNDRFATDGGRNAPSVEGNLLNIRNDNRLQLHLEYSSADPLYESDRGIIQQPSNFAVGGNVVGLGANGEIDPALSARAGSLVTIAGVPGSAATAAPTLGDFAATANQPDTTDQGRYRSLLSSNRDFQANLVYARPLGKAQATVNGQVEYQDGTGFNGLSSLALTLPPGNPFSPFTTPVQVTRGLDGLYGPLTQHNRTVTEHLGTTINGNWSSWSWSFTGNLDHSDSQTITETGVDARAFQARLDANDPTANPFGALTINDVALGAATVSTSSSTSVGGNLLVNGNLFALPAGKVSTAIRVAASSTGFSSRAVRAGVASSADLGRSQGSGQLNIDLPIASRSKQVLGFAGDLSVNFNIAGQQLSDFGTLTTIGYGFNWQPVKGLRIIGSATDRDEAPSIQQLGNPRVETPNVRVFDYVRGTTATITSITGGNPNLVGSTSHVKKLGVTLKPWDKTDVTFTANYVTEHDDNPIAGFPAATAAIERAFPDRFTRDPAGDPNGELIAIDRRPINFASSDRSELRYGFNLSIRLKSKLQKQIEAWRAGTGPNPFVGLRVRGVPPQLTQPGAFPGRPPAPQANQDAPTPPNGQANGQEARGDGAQPAPAGPGGGGPGGGGRGGFGGGRFGRGGGAAQAGGRLQFAVYHTWHFTNRVLVQPGGPSYDLLGGDTVGNSGGQPRHEIDVQAGYANNGLGMRLSANWKSATTVNAGTTGNPQTLRFGDLGTVNLRLFADFGQRLELLKKAPWLRGTRAVIGIDNLFNARQRVTDQNGVVPISYQPGYVDPLGRTIRLSIRKLFFTIPAFNGQRR